MNLGLRYELDTPPTEKSNQWASFDPATATVLVAGGNGVSETAGVKTFKKAFAPRLGFAYQVAQHTVVRGGVSSGTRGTAVMPCGCSATCPSGRSAIAWNYALPFGAGHRWLSGGGPAGYVLGGWQVNGINTFQTGLPFTTPTLSAPTVNTGTGSRPDRIGDGTLSNPTVDRWFDTSLQHSSIRSAERSHRRGQCRNDYQHRRHAQKRPFCAQPANRVAGLIEVDLDAARLCRGRLPARERLRR